MAAPTSDLGVRIRTAGLLAVGAALPIIAGGAAATVFVAAVAAVMGWEFRRLTVPAAGPVDHAGFGAGLAVAAALAGFGEPFWAVEALTATAFVFATLDAMRQRAVAWPVIGAAVPGLGAAVFAALRAMDDGAAHDGLLTVLWITLIVIATDSGAYFAGRKIGGPRLWPTVSPNKTWAGLIGGMALASVTGMAFTLAAGGASLAQMALVSALAGLVAQGGDLAESALKRTFDAKDSGALLPGHGGVLDRVDGFVAVTLVVGAATFATGIPVFRW
jgi:phosphatidate cytidylyltransferase